VVGKRTAEATRALVRDFRRRTGSRVVRLMTSDEYPAYAEVIREAYGVRVVPQRTGRAGRPRKAYTGADPRVVYATVHKERENNRVVGVSSREVFGTFLSDLQHRVGQLKDGGPARLIECATEHVAAELASDRQSKGKCVLAGERFVVVREGELAAVRKAVRRLGYVWPVPGE
jgi:hypothetical protein